MNISEPAVIAKIEADVRMVSISVPVPAAGPHGLAIVPTERGKSLWCAADAKTLAVLDRDTGTIEALLPLPGSPDVVMNDRSIARLFVAVGSPGSSTFSIPFVACRSRSSIPRTALIPSAGTRRRGGSSRSCRRAAA